MATSAFKSNSRRGSTSNSDSAKKAPTRRSHSVSALSRAQNHQSDITSEFLNKRENPLFWSTADKEIQDTVVSSSAALTSKNGQSERGRSVTRNCISEKVAGGGRNQVETGRRGRSVSRGHYAASESEVERDSALSSNYRNQISSNVPANRLKKANSGRNLGDMQRQPTECQAIEPSDYSASFLQIPNCEDGISTGSLSEAEEKTIKAVFEQMKSFQGDHIARDDTTANGIYETVRSEVRRAISDIQNDLESVIQRNNTTAFAAINVANIPPDSVKPGAFELVLDIRREYSRKLEESQERATKLRADLAVEEHRGQELSRILKEILPDLKTNNVQKSRPGRKNSSERKRMSKRLTEEAMTYFDECVSISTFDSSDFSAPEDPPLNLVGAATPVGEIASLGQGSPSISTSSCLNSRINYKQESGGHGLLLKHRYMDSGLTASSSSNEPTTNQAFLRGNDAEGIRKFQFSISENRTENVGLPQDIRDYYINNIEKEFDKGGIKSENLVRSSFYDQDEPLHGRKETLVFDRVLLKNRLDSGSLHLCSGGLAISFSPFGSVI